MTKFMVLYMSPVSAEEQMNVSPEEMKKGMEVWLTWLEKWEKAIVDGGTPLVNGMHYTKKGGSKGKTEVNGYSIVQAKDLDAVETMIADHPHFMMPEASIEVLEMMSMM